LDVRLREQAVPFDQPLIFGLTQPQHRPVDQVVSELFSDFEERLVDGAVRMGDDENGALLPHQLLADRADRLCLARAGWAPDERRVARKRAGYGRALPLVQSIESLLLWLPTRRCLSEDAIAGWIRAFRELLDPLDEDAEQHRKVALQGCV